MVVCLSQPRGGTSKGMRGQSAIRRLTPHPAALPRSPNVKRALFVPVQAVYKTADSTAAPFFCAYGKVAMGCQTPRRAGMAEGDRLTEKTLCRNIKTWMREPFFSGWTE